MCLFLRIGALNSIVSTVSLESPRHGHGVESEGGRPPGLHQGGDHRHEPGPGKRDSIHHHLLGAISETADVLELRQKLLYTTPSGWWWWCINRSSEVQSFIQPEDRKSVDEVVRELYYMSHVCAC